MKTKSSFEIRVDVDTSIVSTGEVLLDVEGVGPSEDQWIIAALLPHECEELIASLTTALGCVRALGSARVMADEGPR